MWATGYEIQKNCLKPINQKPKQYRHTLPEYLILSIVLLRQSSYLAVNTDTYLDRCSLFAQVQRSHTTCRRMLWNCCAATAWATYNETKPTRRYMHRVSVFNGHQPIYPRRETSPHIQWRHYVRNSCQNVGHASRVCSRLANYNCAVFQNIGILLL